jgi:dihydroorotate dehydrogenase
MDRAHALGLLSHFVPKPVIDPQVFCGLPLGNRVGLAAGLDKDGRHIDALAALGFGFLEIGTVTPLPQPGNPKPRMFRLSQVDGIINRMGFNNDGVDACVARVKASRYWQSGGIIGLNIGKNASTPIEAAAEYQESPRPARRSDVALPAKQHSACTYRAMRPIWRSEALVSEDCAGP